MNVFASGFLAPRKLLKVEYFHGLPEIFPDAFFPKMPVDHTHTLFSRKVLGCNVCTAVDT
jgi:hypothetical protein